MGLIRERRGGVTILMAVSATVLIGMAAFTVETANWYVQSAELQRVADSAAMAGALEYVKDNGCNINTIPYVTCYQAAKDYAVMNGVPANNTAVTIGTSPTGSGNSAVQVTLTKSIPLMLSRMISNSTAVNLSASAYAEIKRLAPPCVQALSPTGTPDVKITGNVVLDGCSLWSKSSATGATQSAASVSLTGNSTMGANVYTPGSIYVGGSSAFTGKRYLVTQAAVSDFIGSRSAVTTALSDVSSVQSMVGPTMTNPSTNAQTWTGPVNGDCTLNISGPQSYASITISAGTCSPFKVNFTGDFQIGRAGTNGAAVTVTGNAAVNFGAGAVTFNGFIALAGQTGGCFGLGTISPPNSGSGCAPNGTSGTYYVGVGSGSNSSTSIVTGSGSLVVGPGVFWSGGDLQLTGAGTVSWNASSSGTSTAKIAGSLLLGTSSMFGAGSYQIKSNLIFPLSGNGNCNNTTSSGSLVFGASGTSSSLVTVGGSGSNGGLCLGSNGNSATYSYQTTSTTFVLAQAPTLHGAGSGTHSLTSPCTQTAATTCASNLTGSGIAGLLMALPQGYTGTANVPSENTGSITLGGMLYAKSATLNLQGNASNSGCFGFVVWTASLSGTAAFSTCSTLQGTALGMTLVQ